MGELSFEDRLAAMAQKRSTAEGQEQTQTQAQKAAKQGRKAPQRSGSRTVYDSNTTAMAFDKRAKKAGDDNGEDQAEGRKRPPRRADKNMPIEVTAKRPVGRYRPVVELKTAEKVTDPRFLSHAGEFNEDLYKRSYGFIKDYQKDELATLKKRLAKTKNKDTSMGIAAQVDAMESKLRNAGEKDRRAKVVRDWRKEEKALVMQGKKPHYLKESDVKKLVLLDKYENIKGRASSDNTFEKMLEKRRKKNASKERRSLPFQRRSAEH